MNPSIRRAWALQAAAVSCLVAVNTVEAQTGPDFDAVRSEIQRVLTEYDAASLSVAVAMDGEVVWEEGFGWADQEHRIPATEHTMYSLASISKPITSTGLMVLVERGLVDLDEPVNAYLGDAKINGRAFGSGDVTVAQVASHTAGLPLHYQFFYEDEPYRRPPMDETIRRYANLVTAPGERWHYSNLGYGILDYLIERVSGQSYADFMRSEVFLPLGLTRTSVDIGEGLEPYAATRYAPDGSRIPFYDFDHPGGSAVFSSAHDLVRFGMFHLQNDVPGQRAILSPGSIEKAHTPIARSGPAGQYGLGWSITEHPSGLQLVRHGGGMGGVRTELVIVPSENAAFVVLQNATTPATGYITELLMAAAFPDRVERPEAPPRPAPPAPLDLSASAAEPLSGLEGDWEGFVDTPSGPLGMSLSVGPDGHVAVRLEDQLWTLVNEPRLRDGTLTGVFVGDLGNEDVNRTDHALVLDLHVRGDVLNGAVVGQSRPAVRLGNALSHWAELRRR